MNNKQILIMVGCVAVGAAAAAPITYFATRKKIRKDAFEWADAEVASVKETYKLLRKEPPYDDPATAAKAYIERMDELQYIADNGVEAAAEEAQRHVQEKVDELEDAVSDAEDIQQVSDILETEEYGRATSDVHNIFDRARQVFEESQANEEDEERYDDLNNRAPRPPFVIPTDEFFDDSNEFDKITISYFEADDTLADDRQSVIPDIEGVIGQANLLKFGEESDDKNIVYIRNETLRVDYEVTREEGSYTEIVGGYRVLEDDDRDRRVKRMRDDE